MRVSAPLAAAALGALAVVFAMTAVVWLVIGGLEDENVRHTGGEVLADVAEVYKLSALLSAGLTPTTAQMTPESIAGEQAVIAGHTAQLTERLEAMDGQGYDARVARVQQRVDALASNAALIAAARPALLEAIRAGERSWGELLFSTNQLLLPALGASLDDQFHYVMTGTSDNRDAGAPVSGPVPEEEYLRYWHMATLREWTFSAHRSLLAANLSSQDDPTRLANNEESFDTAAQRLRHSIAYLAGNGGPDLDPEVIPRANRLLAAGAGEDSALDAMRQRGAMVARERQLLDASSQILAGLQGEVDGLVAEVAQRSAAAVDQHAQEVSDGRRAILVAASAGIAGTLLAAVYAGFRRRGAVPAAGGFLGVAAFIAAAAAAGWLTIDALDAQNRGDDDVAALAAVAEMTWHTGALASAASTASNVRMTPESIAAGQTAIAAHEAQVRGRLAALGGRGYAGAAAALAPHVDQLTANAARIEAGRPAVVGAMAAGERNWQALSLAANNDLFPALGSSLDNQFYAMMTGRSALRAGAPAGAGHRSREEYLRYWHMAALRDSASQSYWTLDFANRLTIPALTARVEETFETAAHRMERSIAYLEENGGPDLHPEALSRAQRLLAVGADEDSPLDAMKARTGLVAREQRQIGANGEILAGLLGGLEGVVTEVAQRSTDASARHAQAASNGRIALLVIAVLGLAGTLLAAGYAGVRARPR